MAFYQQGGTIAASGGTFTGPVTFSSTVTSSGGLNVTGALNSNAIPWQPSDNGQLAAVASLDGAGTTTAALVAGSVYVIKLVVRTAFTWTSTWLLPGVAGTGATSGSFTGLYNSGGTLLTTSADIATGLQAATAFSTALTSAQSLAAGTFVWAAILSNLATTQPQMRGFSTPGFATVNENLTAAVSKVAVAATVQTTLPASFTPSSLTQSGISIWVAAS